MTSTGRGARLRAVKTAGAAAAALALPVAPADAADPPSPRAAALRAPIAGHLTVAGQMRAAARAYEQRRLTRVAERLAERAGDRRVTRTRLGRDSPAALRGRIANLRRRLRAPRRVAVPPALESIASCESGGDPRAIGGGGLYRGKYQFDYATWGSVGGTGDPATAPEAEQDMRAARLYARAGAAPWPVCGR